jgi:hypothetical protein
VHGEKSSFESKSNLDTKEIFGLQPVTFSYSEPEELQDYLFRTNPNIVLPFMPSISKWSVMFRLSGQHFVLFLGFVIPSIFKYSNKAPNQMQQSVLKFIAYSHRRCSTCFRHCYTHHQELFQTAVAASDIHINAKQTDHSWKNIHLGIYTENGGCDCSLKELLMMGVMMPETC